MINFDFVVTIVIGEVAVDMLMFYAAESEEEARGLLETAMTVNKQLSAGLIQSITVKQGESPIFLLGII